MTPTVLRRRVGARIRKARWRMGWTQEEAAVAAELSVRYYAEVERGHRNPTLDTLHAMAGAMRVTMADLVDIEPKKRVDLDAIEVEPVPSGRKRKG